MMSSSPAKEEGAGVLLQLASHAISLLTMGVGICVRVTRGEKEKEGRCSGPLSTHVSLFSEGGEMGRRKAARVNRENFGPIFRH